jgi:tetratricopeptide (TPR) repeat protein
MKATREVSLLDMPFEQLIKRSPELAELRRKYSTESPKNRRQAADFAYHSEMANYLFNQAIVRTGQEPFGQSRWPSGVEALAIDPLFAPALLTVGSLEYQCGRPEEAMKLFLTLTTLPAKTKDLSVIIDKTGDFLIDQKDWQRARDLYTAAAKAYPRVAVYPAGLGYCLGKLGQHSESVAQHRRAVELEPDNYQHLNDLGWSLTEAGQYDEAHQVLEKAAAVAPADYELPQINLKELERRRSNSARSKTTRTPA